MRKIINILIFTLLVLSVTAFKAPKDTDVLVKEIIVHNKGEIYRHTYYYNSNNNITIEVKYKMIDDFPNPISRTEWVYSNGLCTAQIDQIFNDGNWDLSHKIQTNYIGSLKESETYFNINNGAETIYKTVVFSYMTGKIKQINTYLGVKDPGLLSQVITYTYDDDNQLINQTLHLDTENGTIIQSYDYKYNIEQLIDSVIMSEIIQEEKHNQSLSRFFYHPDTDMISKQIQKIWDISTMSWINNTKVEYLYDENQHLTEEQYHYFSVLFWSPDSKYEYVYDSNGLLLEQVMYQPIYEKWRRLYTISYSDIEKNKPSVMESKYNFWGGEAGSYVNNFIPFYFNDDMTIMQADKLELLYILQTDDLITQYEGETGWINIYPNPSNGVFYISTDKYRIDSWYVHNISGQIVKSKRNNYHTGLVDLTQLPDGVYMFNAQTLEGQYLKQKVIIQRSR